MNKQRKADLLLVLVTAFWGMSYFLMDLALTDLQPMNLNLFRFGGSFVLLYLAFFKKMRHISAATLKYAVIIGIFLAGCYIFCTYAVMLTSLSNAGFICALPVVTTPILQFFYTGEKPGRRLAICLAICTFGLALLTLGDGFRPALGDVVCLGAPLCYAFDLIYTDRAVAREDVDPLQLGVLELGVVGVIMLILTFAIEQPHLPQSPAVWGSVIFLGLFCTGFAFMIQTVQQQYTTASHVGLIFTLEPLFSAVVAYFLANEVLSPRGYVGAALMMGSLILMEVRPNKAKSTN